MSKNFDYDLIVLGGGIAGMVSAVTANGLGKKVAVIEKSRIGGNCTNTTCIPSKALINLSHINHDIKRLVNLSIINDLSIPLNTEKIMPHIRGIIQKAYEKDRPETFKEIGIDVIEASASFVDSHHIDIGGKTLSASKFIIATGTKPFIPPIEGLKDIDYLTNENLYYIDDLPKSLIILGGGVDGLEYASAFGLLGIKTTVVEMATRLLPMVDLELVNHLLVDLKNKGIRILSGAKAVRFFKREDKVVLTIEHTKNGTSEDIEAHNVIVTVGRRPDIEGLSLEKAGVEYNPRGVIVDNKLRTTAPHIFACGDIAGPYQLASTAEAQAILAATNAFLPVKRGVDYSNNVYVIFTNPPIAYMGLTEEQAYERFNDKLKVYRIDYKNMRRAIIDGKNYGLAKILCDSKGYIIGAHILGEAGPEVIHEIQVIKAMDTPLHRLNNATHAYPTYSQALVGRAEQLAFLDYMEGHILVKIGLGLMPGFKNRLRLTRERLAESGPYQAPVKTIRYRDPSLYCEISDVRAEIKAKSQDSGSFSIETSENKDFIKIDIKGHLNGMCEAILHPIFIRTLEQSKGMVLDLSGVSHIDMEGAGIIIKSAVMLSEKGKKLEVTGLSEELTDLFHFMRFDEIMKLSSHKTDAQENPLLKENITFNWAKPVDLLEIRDIPDHAMNINVHGRRVTSPAIGYGPMWEKRYQLHLEDSFLEPQEIVSLWRAKFPEFWPKGNTAFTSENRGISPNTTAVLNLSLPGGLTLATGIFVVYADDTSFGFLTVEGHMLSGWITFSSFYEGNSVVIQVHPLFRAADPVMELGLRLGGAAQEDLFWHRTLKNIARHIGTHGTIKQHNIVVDERTHWDKKTDLWKNAAIRSSFYMPIYLVKKIINPKRNI